MFSFSWVLCVSLLLLAHSKNELMQWRGFRRLSVCLSICKLLRKSLFLADNWPDRHQTCTRWSPGKPASRVCSRSRWKSKVTWYALFLGFLEWATPSLTVWSRFAVQPTVSVGEQATWRWQTASMSAYKHITLRRLQIVTINKLDHQDKQFATQPSHCRLTPSLQRIPANIHINLIVL